MDGAWELELIGGRRRSIAGGRTDLGICHYLGPTGGGVDLRTAAGSVLVRIRGGTMPVPDYHATLHTGERMRLYGDPERVTLESSLRGKAEVRVEEPGGGWRVFTLVERGPIAGVFRVRPRRQADPWRLEVPSFGDPLRALAALHAAERLLHEADRRAAAEA